MVRKKSLLAKREGFEGGWKESGQKGQANFFRENKCLIIELLSVTETF